MKQHIRVSVSVVFSQMFNFTSFIQENSNFRKITIWKHWKFLLRYWWGIFREKSTKLNTLFHNAEFVIYEEYWTLEFSYAVVASKWKKIPTIFILWRYLIKWRKTFFKDYFEDLASSDIDTNNLFCSEKK